MVSMFGIKRHDLAPDCTGVCSRQRTGDSVCVVIIIGGSGIFGYGVQEHLYCFSALAQFAQALSLLEVAIASVEAVFDWKKYLKDDFGYSDEDIKEDME